MPDVRLLLILLTAVVVLAGFARRLSAPYPVVLLVGGIAIGQIPGVPSPHITPELIFLIFLPPLVYAAAVVSSTAELRAEAPAIGRLAIGLVLLTIGAVALLAHALVGLDWTLALLLGAIVGSTDPIAASSVVRRLGAPQRIETVLEGESLVNDGTSLTAYQVLLGALAGGSLALGSALGELALTALGGVAIGIGTGLLATSVHRRLDAADVAIALSLLTAYASYIAADELGASGILAAVAAGLVVGNAELEERPESRLQAGAFWDTLTFLLNSVLFVLVGLELRRVLDGVSAYSAWTLLGWAAAVAAVVVAVRMAWMFAIPPLLGGVARALRGEQERPPWQEQLALGWSGMRGVVALAAALALPLGGDGLAAEQRSLLIFLTFTTIVATLVVPGLTLGPLLRRLGLAQSAARRHEQALARLELLHAALARVEQLSEEADATAAARGDGGARPSEEALARTRTALAERVERLEGRVREWDGERPPPPSAERVLQRELLGAERAKLAELRAGGRYSLEALRRVERDLDLEESRLRR